MGQTWVRHCPITNKYWCQGCALRKIEGSPVLWTCEILGAQHIISIEKVTFSSRPGANLVANGYRTLLVLTALYLLQIWLMLILLLLADLCAKDKEFPLQESGVNFRWRNFPKSTSGLGYEANPFFVGVWVCFSGTKQNIILLISIKVINHIAIYKFVFYSFFYLFNKMLNAN